MLSSPSQTRRVRGYNRTTNNCDCIAHSILVFLDSFLSVLNLQHKDNRSIVEAGKGPIFNSQHFPTPRWIPACSISDIFGAAILYRHCLRQSPKPSGGNNSPCTMSSGIILLHIRFPAFSNPSPDRYRHGRYLAFPEQQFCTGFVYGIAKPIQWV